MAKSTKDPEERQAIIVKSSGPILLAIGIVAVICILTVGLVVTRQSSGAVKTPPDPALYDLGDFTTNLSDASDLKYVKTDVTLELSNKSLEKEVQGEEPLLRDCIIGLLNNATSNDIMVSRDKFKQDVMSQLNKKLNTGQITNIYLSDLIMQ